jgi:putative peptidoglycan lipid II flippase
MYNLGIIVGALFLTESMGVHGLAWGTVLGAALHFGVQVPALRKLEPRYRLNFNIRTEGVTEVLVLMGPRVLGLAIVQINFWVNTALASTLEAAITMLTYSFQVMLMPQAIIAQSVATAVFPTLSAHATTESMDEYRATLGGALRSVLFLSIPATVGLVVMAEPIIAVLYQSGEWTAQDTTGTAHVLIFWGVGLVGHSIVEILARAFYALSDTRTPVIVGGGAMMLNVVFSVAFIAALSDAAGAAHSRAAMLAFANSAATALESVGLWLWLRRKLAGDFAAEERRILASAARVIAASLVMGAALLALLAALDGVSRYVVLAAGVAVGGVVFGTASYALGVGEIRQMAQVVRSKLRL